MNKQKNAPLTNETARQVSEPALPDEEPRRDRLDEQLLEAHCLVGKVVTLRNKHTKQELTTTDPEIVKTSSQHTDN